MAKLRDIWKFWVYDSTHLPISWSQHPHDAFKVSLRFMFAFLGSIVPVGIILVYSGVLGKLNDGIDQIGLEFTVVAIVFFASWLISVIFAANSEEKSIVKHIFIGSIGPANIALILKLMQQIAK